LAASIPSNTIFSSTESTVDGYSTFETIRFLSEEIGDAVGQAVTIGTSYVKLSKCTFNMIRGGNPTGNVRAKLYASTGTVGINAIPTGTVLATSNTLDISTISTSSADYNFIFSGSEQYIMSPNTNYIIVLDVDFTYRAALDRLGIIQTTSNFHYGNASIYLSSWSNLTGDLRFILYGYLGDNYLAKTEDNYLLLNTADSGSTGLQNKPTTWNSAEWAGVINTFKYAHDATNAVDSSKLVDITADPDADITDVALGANQKDSTILTTTYESQTETATNNAFLYGGSGLDGNSQTWAQSFLTTSSHYVNKITLPLIKYDSPSDGVYLQIRSGSYTGPVVATSETIPASEILTSTTNKDFIFSSPVLLSNATTYFICIWRTGGYNSTNCYGIAYKATSAYSNGTLYVRNNNETWSEWAGSDIIFYIKHSTAMAMPTTAHNLDVNVINTTGVINAARIIVTATVVIGPENKQGLFSISASTSIIAVGSANKQGSFSISATTSTVVVGAKDNYNKSGSFEVTAIASTIVVGLKNARDSPSISSSSNVIVAGKKNGIGLLDISSVIDTTSYGKKNGIGTIAVSATFNVTITGAKDSYDKSGSFAVTAIASTIVVGLKSSRDSPSTSASSEVTVAGTKAVANSISTSASSEVIIAGTKAVANSISTSASSDVTAAGKKATSTSISTSASSDVTVLGKKSAGNSISTSASSDVTVLGKKSAGNSISTSASSDVIVIGKKSVGNSISTSASSDATVTGKKSVGNSISTSASSEITIVGKKTVAQVIAISAEFNITVEEKKAAITSISTSSSTDVAVTGKKSIANSISTSSSSEVTITGKKAVANTISTSASSNVTVTGSKSVAQVIAISSATNTIVEGNKATSGPISVSSVTNVDVRGGNSQNNSIDISAITNVAVTGKKATQASTSVSASSDVIVTGKKQTSGNISVESIPEVSTAGTKGTTKSIEVQANQGITISGQKGATGIIQVSAVSSVNVIAGEQLPIDKEGSFDLLISSEVIVSGKKDITTSITISEQLSVQVAGKKGAQSVISVVGVVSIEVKSTPEGIIFCEPHNYTATLKGTYLYTHILSEPINYTATLKRTDRIATLNNVNAREVQLDPIYQRVYQKEE